MPAFSQLMHLITPLFQAQASLPGNPPDRAFAGTEAGPVSWVGPTQAAPAQFWRVSWGRHRTCPSGAGRATWKHQDFKTDPDLDLVMVPWVPVAVLLIFSAISMNDFNIPSVVLQQRACVAYN